MSTVYIRNQPYPLLARVRRAAPPFQDQNVGHLVGVDYVDWQEGGACNVRLTREQAQALRDALDCFLTRGHSIVIAKDKAGKFVSEETPE